MISAGGSILIPGFIDAHAHLFWLHNVNEAVRYAMKGGTTTIVTEVMEVLFASGYNGILEFLDAIHDQPIKIFILIPSGVSISKSASIRCLNDEEVQELLKCREVLGIGEACWPFVLRKDERILKLFNEAIASGRKIEGHAAGAKGKKLIAYISAGVSSCHESITTDDIIERLRLGVDVMIREGSIRRELENVSNIKYKISDFRKISLVSDGVFPRDLTSKGYMDYIVQRAIDLGFDPIRAIQMATINPAQHFSLDNVIGGIAPFRYADILMIDDLKKIVNPRMVISNGKVIVSQGKLLIEPKKPTFSMCKNVINLPRKILPSEFFVHGKGRKVKARVIKYVTDLVTREVQQYLSVSNGLVESNPKQDILKVAFIDLLSKPNKIFTGFVTGFKIRRGAFATSAAWDAFGILVVGANEEDMANAVNRVAELRGGITLSVDKEIVMELPLPISGIISDLPMETLAEKLDELQLELKKLGCTLHDAHLTLATITSPAIPFIRICEDGLVDIRTGELLSLIVECIE